MKLDLTTTISTPQLNEILSSVGQGDLLKGTVYQPLMQLLVAPSQDTANSVHLWELTQKFYAFKESEVELTNQEVNLLKAKLETIVFPWLKARLLSLLTE